MEVIRSDVRAEAEQNIIPRLNHRGGKLLNRHNLAGRESDESPIDFQSSLRRNGAGSEGLHCPVIVNLRETGGGEDPRVAASI